MGVFDLFGREPRVKREKEDLRFDNKVSEKNPSGQGPISVFCPTSYQQVEEIIDALKAGKTAVVHLDELKTETAIRILDMLAGAVYALGGGVYEMQKNVFMFSSMGVEVKQ